VPLYTFITTYEGQTYVSQATRSNYEGHADWVNALPKTVMSKWSKEDHQRFKWDVFGGFHAIPNRANTWIKTMRFGGSDMIVVAVQTEK
jgi:hypothetical protein